MADDEQKPVEATDAPEPPDAEPAKPAAGLFVERPSDLTTKPAQPQQEANIKPWHIVALLMFTVLFVWIAASFVRE